MKTSLGVVILLLLAMHGVLPVYSSPVWTSPPGIVETPHVTYFNAPYGVGTGIYTCTDYFMGKKACTEMSRCGPEVLSHPGSLIECHGIVAKCEDWGTLKTRTNGDELGLSLVIDGTHVWLRDWSPNQILQVTGLANFCIAQK